MKEFAIENMLDLNETIAKELFEGKEYPWAVSYTHLTLPTNSRV